MTFCNALTAKDLQIADAVAGLYAPAVATFGGNLRKLREARGLSQEELARRMGHARPSTVQSWEKNRRRPRPAAIQALAERLDCSVIELLNEVPSDYDTLRGDGPPVTDTPGEPSLTPIERRVLKLLRGMRVEGQRLAVQSIAGYAVAFPREPLPEQAAPPLRRPEATGRKGRGTRKAAEG